MRDPNLARFDQGDGQGGETAAEAARCKYSRCRHLLGAEATIHSTALFHSGWLVFDKLAPRDMVISAGDDRGTGLGRKPLGWAGSWLAGFPRWMTQHRIQSNEVGPIALPHFDMEIFGYMLEGTSEPADEK
jgi:hypothetical protein